MGERMQFLQCLQLVAFITILYLFRRFTVSYPGPKVHRVNRRKLGRGQFATATGVNVVVTSTGTTNVTLTFSRPVVVTGIIPVTVATRTLVSQTVVSQTVVTQVWSAAVTGLAYAVPAGAANVLTNQGGPTTGAAGTFP
jgi:hypothetical protein